MNAALTRSQIEVATRPRLVITVFAFMALALGLGASSSASDWVLPISILLLIAIGALVIPLAGSVLLLVGLIPIQLYLPVPGTSFSVRVAAFFAVALALRVLPLYADTFWARWRTWIIPTALFTVAVLLGALGAPNPYLAFRGIYDWVPFFSAWFIAGQIAVNMRLVEKVLIGLILGGIAEAILGLLQYFAGPETVLGVLQHPLSAAFYQPDLLQERLVDLSFNWVSGDRFLPFGTFINGIDFAVYVAAMLVLVLALLLNQVAPSLGRAAESGDLFGTRLWPRNIATLGLIVAAGLLGLALALTLKGSGFIAVGGGITVIALCALRLRSRQISTVILVLIGVGLAAVLASVGPLSERVTFLIQREQGLAGSIGRLEIWGQVLSHWPERPLFGFGLNNAGLLAEPTRTLSGGAFALISTSPESAPVALLVETGIVGFLGLCLFLGIAVVRSYRAATSPLHPMLAVGVLGAIVAIVLGNLTVSGLTTDQNGMLLGVLIGIAGGAWNRR